MSEIHAYNVVDDQDPDILNQGTFIHAKRYFERKEQEEREKLIDNSTLAFRLPYTNDTRRSINNVSFFIKLIILLLFIWVIYDFVFGYEKRV